MLISWAEKSIVSPTLLNLYLFYLRLEKEKKSGQLQMIPFYALDGFSRFECNGDVKHMADYFDSAKKINRLVTIYGVACSEYTKSYIRQHNTDYTRMIKEEIDYSLLQANHSSAVSMYEHMSQAML